MGYWKIQPLLIENCVGTAETGCVWTGGSTSSEDTCSEIWGDGIDAVVKDGAVIVINNQRRFYSNISLRKSFQVYKF